MLQHKAAIDTIVGFSAKDFIRYVVNHSCVNILHLRDKVLWNNFYLNIIREKDFLFIDMRMYLDSG